MRSKRRVIPVVLLFLLFAVSVYPIFGQDQFGGDIAPAAPSSSPAQETAKRFTPTYFEGEFRAYPETFVIGDAITVEGVIAFDQIFSVHWEDLSQERLRIDPFKVMRVTIGPQKPRAQAKEFFADERTVIIHLALRDEAKRGGLKIPSIRLGYSWHDGIRLVRKTAVFGPWNVNRAPIRIFGSLSADVMHLGERAELRVDIVREKGIRVLNQFLGVLNDENVPETEKAELRRWLKSLEARKESAFNLAFPDVKPMKVVKKESEEIDRGLSAISRYRYTVAYYEEAKKTISLPQVKIWYVLQSGGAGEYREPSSIALDPFRVFIASRVSGTDRRLEGPISPEVVSAGMFAHYGFGYGLPAVGGIAVILGLALVFSGSGHARETKRVRRKPISFRKASRGFSFFATEESGGKHPFLSGPSAVRKLRHETWAVIGAMLGFTHEEARAKSADEVVSLLTSRYARNSIEPVLRLAEFCDHAMAEADATSEKIAIPKDILDDVAPFFRKKSLWRLLPKSKNRGTAE